MTIELPADVEHDSIRPNTGGAWLWLCEIAVPLEAVERFARNTEDITYAGNLYPKANMDIGEQIFSSDGSIPQVTLQIFQDINGKIEEVVQKIQDALGTQVKLIKANSRFLDDAIPALEADYEALAAESDSEWATFTLGIPNPLTQRIPLRIFSSSSCPWATPSLFRGPECQYSGDDHSCTGTFQDCKEKGNAAHWGGELGLDPSLVQI